MKFRDIEKPSSLVTALIFSGLAWIVLRFLHSPGAERPANKTDEADRAVASL